MYLKLSRTKFQTIFLNSQGTTTYEKVYSIQNSFKLWFIFLLIETSFRHVFHRSDDEHINDGVEIVAGFFKDFKLFVG